MYFLDSIRRIAISLLCVITPIYSSAQSRTGFITRDDGYYPTAKSFFASDKPLSLPNPQDKSIIIYQHGHGPALQNEDCNKWYNSVPEGLSDAEDKETKVYYICSSVADDRGKPGSLLYKRIKQFKEVIDELIAIGVRKERIFLSGHSTGGWAVLLMQSELEGLGGAILFAPAATGKKIDVDKYPIWKNSIRPKWVNDIVQGPAINALIFAYIGDSFEEPEDLMFIKEKSPDKVQIVSYSCPYVAPDQHFIPFRDCRAKETAALIRGFISGHNR